jgi:hypothetical protein
LINRNEIYTLRLKTVSKTRCVLAFVEDVELNDFEIGFSVFDASVERLAFPGYSPSSMTLNAALNQLDNELPLNDPNAPVVGMLSYIFEGLSSSIFDSVNGFDGFNGPINECEVPIVTIDILSGVLTQAHANRVIDEVLLLEDVCDWTTAFDVPNESPAQRRQRRRQLCGDRVVVELTTEVFEGDITDSCTEAPTYTITTGKLKVRTDRAATIDEREAFIEEMKLAVAPIRAGETPAVTIQLGRSSPCAALNLPNGIAPACNWWVENNGNITRKFLDWTADRLSPLDQQLPAAFLESSVKINVLTDQYYDVRNSAIVRSVSSYFSGNPGKVRDLLRAEVNRIAFL